MTIGQRFSQFLIPPVLLIVALVAYRYAMVRPVPDRVQPAKVEPWVIAPRFTEPRIATDEQLTAVLIHPRYLDVGKNHRDHENVVHAQRLFQ